MGKVSLYILLCLIYVGFSKSMISIKENRPYLKSQKTFDSFFQNAPISVVLTQTFQRGYFLKSYFLKFRIVHAYFPYEEIEIQTSEEFFNENLKNIGMAIYQRKSLELPGSSLAQPAGTIFIGDLTYGSWILAPSGEKLWEFHRAFRRFPKILGWGDFRPSQEFLQKLKIYETYKKSFYGLQNEFGTLGSVSSKYFINLEKENSGESFMLHLKGLFTWKKDQKK